MASRRIASYGRPGAGKSTFSAALAHVLAKEKGRPVAVLKVGALLYTLQGLVYEAAGAPAPEPGQQDGALLNSLASHLRRINPAALTDAFALAVAGWLIAPDSSDDLAAALVHALTDKRERSRRAANGAVHARENYSWPTVADRYAAVYAQAIDSHPTTGAA
ncbi:hypothetical protein ACWC5I_23805 [Kitasatospora sp. NPDC001574]